MSRRLAQIKFEQGSVAAQQGQLEKAVALYRETIALATQADKAALSFAVLGYNNLAYHLLLLHDPTAIDYARQGWQLAHEQGALGIQPYLLSTLGEIELDHDLEAAEKYFTDGLALSERLSMPERVAGLTANLGRVAQRRGETTLAIHRLSTALAKAEALGLPHLTAQIRVVAGAAAAAGRSAGATGRGARDCRERRTKATAGGDCGVEEKSDE